MAKMPVINLRPVGSVTPSLAVRYLGDVAQDHHRRQHHPAPSILDCGLAPCQGLPDALALLRQLVLAVGPGCKRCEGTLTLRQMRCWVGHVYTVDAWLDGTLCPGDVGVSGRACGTAALEVGHVPCPCQEEVTPDAPGV